MAGDHTSSATPRPLDVRWARRPVLGWIVRASAIAGPFVLSLVVAWTLTSITDAPEALFPAFVRWLVIAVISSIVLVVLERVGRRLLPIAALLDLTLVFPDRAPSRFRVAIRTGTTSQLERRIEEAQAGYRSDTPAASAERVIELVAALRVHDHITRGHSERVRAYTQMIAEEMDLSDEELDRLRWAGLLHDVGKLLVPTSILNRQGRLTDDEYELIKSHPENGRRIIENLVPWLGESARAVWEHHEKWDGSGYPRGLAGEEISLAARIVAVADVYDVLTSARSYKEPISPKEARAELARCAGSHFDPAVVRAFLNLSIGRVRRAAGPLSWVAQLSLFPTAVFSSTQAAGSAVVLTGALGASSAGVGTEVMGETFSHLDPRAAVAWLGTEVDATDHIWQLSTPVAEPPLTPPSTSAPNLVGVESAPTTTAPSPPTTPPTTTVTVVTTGVSVPEPDTGAVAGAIAPPVNTLPSGQAEPPRAETPSSTLPEPAARDERPVNTAPGRSTTTLPPTIVTTTTSPITTLPAVVPTPTTTPTTVPTPIPTPTTVSTATVPTTTPTTVPTPIPAGPSGDAGGRGQSPAPNPSVPEPGGPEVDTAVRDQQATASTTRQRPDTDAGNP